MKRYVRKVGQILFNACKRIKIIIKAIFSRYLFTKADYWHYLLYAEYPGLVKDFPRISELDSVNDFVKLSINNNIYYWPQGISSNGLEWIYSEVYAPSSVNFHAYEYEHIKIYPDQVVVDAGASEGFFTRYALDKGARVIAFEPVQLFTEALTHTFFQEIANGKLKVEPYALGTINGEAKIRIDQNNIFDSRIADDGEGVVIQIVSLDEAVKNEEINFIKMDIEGAEIEAIMGAKGIISKHKPNLAIAVYHAEENAREVCRLIKEIRDDYIICHRGIYAWGDCALRPRPMMIYAW